MLDTPLTDALDEVIDSLRVDIAKALDPNNDDDFIEITNQLAKATAGLTGAEEAKALAAAIKALDVDWSKMTPAAKAKVFKSVQKAVNPSKKVLPKLEKHFEVNAAKLGQQAKESATKKFGLVVKPILSEVDKGALKAVAKSQGNYVRDEYGKRSVAFSKKAQKIVERGLKKGTGRAELAKELKAKLTTAQFNRSEAYWNLIAASFANRSRTYGNLSSFSDNGITTFMVVAVRDERTSTICRFLHGRTFKTADALKAYQKTEDAADPEDIRFTQPWVRESKGQLWYPDASGKRKVVANVTDNAKGKVDASGSYGRSMGDKALAKNGILTPPFHGHCRTTIIPDTSVVIQAPTAPPAPVAPPPPPLEDMPPPPEDAVPVDLPPPATFNGDVVEKKPVLLSVLPPPVKPVVPPPPIKAYKMTPSQKKQMGLKALAEMPIAAEGKVKTPFASEKAMGQKTFDMFDNVLNVANSEDWKKKKISLENVHVGDEDYLVDPLAVSGFLKNPQMLKLAMEKVHVVEVKAADGTPMLVCTNGHAALTAHKLMGAQKANVGVINAYKFKLETNAKAKAAAAKPSAPPLPPAPALPKLSPAQSKLLATVNANPNYAPQPHEWKAAYHLMNEGLIEGAGKGIVQSKKPADSPTPLPPAVDPSAIKHKLLPGGPKGSNPGAWYEGKDGVVRYVKEYENQGQANSELLANAIYKQLGVGAPNAVGWQDTNAAGQKILAYASEKIEGQPITAWTKPQAKDFMKGFVGDVLMANRDAVGAATDNVIVKDGKVYRIDNGGSLFYRAQGSTAKPGLDSLSELHVFFNGNRQYAAAAKAAGYKSVDDFKDEFHKQIKDVLKVQKDYGGSWDGFVQSYAPGMSADEQKRVAKLLDARTRMLEDLLPKEQPKAPPGALWRDRDIKGVAPRKDLDFKDLPKTPLPDNYGRDAAGKPKVGSHSGGKMPGGLKEGDYEDLIIKHMNEAKAPVSEIEAIRTFTGGSYRAFRRAETDPTWGKQNDDPLNPKSAKQLAEERRSREAFRKLSDRVQEGLAKIKPTPCTVYRGADNMDEKDVLAMMRNDGVFRLGHFNRGATSSATWSPDVAINQFMGGTGDSWGNKYKVLYQINHTSGVGIQHISNVKHEKEILLSKHAQFRLVGVAKQEGSERVIVFQLEEIESAPLDEEDLERRRGIPRPKAPKAKK